MYMKPRKFIYVGNPIPQIKLPENNDFVIHFQKSMLLSLVKRNLLTQEQMNCVLTELEKQCRKTKP